MKRISKRAQDLPRLLYPRPEAAYLLGICTRSIDYLIRDGRLKARRIGGRVLISAEDLIAYAAADRDDAIVPKK